MIDLHAFRKSLKQGDKLLNTILGDVFVVAHGIALVEPILVSIRTGESLPINWIGNLDIWKVIG